MKHSAVPIKNITRDASGAITGWSERGFDFTVSYNTDGLPIIVNGTDGINSVWAKLNYVDGKFAGFVGDSIDSAVMNEIFVVAIGRVVTTSRDPVTGRVRKATAGTADLPYLKPTGASYAPYRMATFGDSRANVGALLPASPASATNYQVVGNKVPTWIARWLNDTEIVFNGGISGDTTATWNTARGTSQSVSDCIASNPDFVYVQYGINDAIAGTAAATTILNLKRLIGRLWDAGIFVVFEAINPANDVAGTFVTGASSTGGFGATPSAKAQIVADVNAAIRSFIADNSGRGIYVDTYTGLLDPARILGTSNGLSYGYENTAYYQDGTHLHATACMQLGQTVATAIRDFFPLRDVPNFLVPGTKAPSFLNSAMVNPTAGVAENSFASASNFEAGTGTVAASIVTVDGFQAQQIIVTPATLASGENRFRIDIGAPIGGGSPTFAVSAGDILQAQAWVQVDDGNGGAPGGVYKAMIRQRLFKNPSGSIFSDSGDTAGTIPPAFDRPIKIRESLPRINTDSASAAIFDLSAGNKTGLQVIVSTQTLTPYRLLVWGQQMRKMA